MHFILNHHNIILFISSTALLAHGVWLRPWLPGRHGHSLDDKELASARNARVTFDR